MTDDGDLPWREWAACLGHDHKVFFPERGQTTRAAKAVCQSCPVMIECLEFALETRQKFGVWGGMGETDRASILRNSPWAIHSTSAQRVEAYKAQSKRTARREGQTAQATKDYLTDDK